MIYFKMNMLTVENNMPHEIAIKISGENSYEKAKQIAQKYGFKKVKKVNKNTHRLEI